MAGQIVCIRLDRAKWEAFKEVANSLGFSRNELIRLFIDSILMGKTQIEQKNNITNVNINLVPINNVMINQTKMQKNRLVVKEIEKTIEQAYECLNRNGSIPYGIKDKLKKLINKASYIPQDLYEQAEKIIFT